MGLSNQSSSSANSSYRGPESPSATSSSLRPLEPPPKSAENTPLLPPDRRLYYDGTGSEVPVWQRYTPGVRGAIFSHSMGRIQELLRKAETTNEPGLSAGQLMLTNEDLKPGEPVSSRALTVGVGVHMRNANVHFPRQSYRRLSLPSTWDTRR